MKRKMLLFPAILFFASLLFKPGNAVAQSECGSRYLDSIFPLVDTTFSVIYTTTAGGGTDTQTLDVYQPHGDTATNRRMIVWAHGGAFFEGTKNDNDMQFLCTNFAKRGYVCASINYRLASSVLLLYDSMTAFKYIVEAMNDMKAAIRYFRKDAANGNTFNIDSNMIFSGGGSAGAIMVDFCTTIDSVAETPAYFQAVMNSQGGIEGNSGNPGYSYKVVAAASLAGGISNVDWIGPGNPPTFYAQGTADPIIPYDCSAVFYGYTHGGVPGLFRLCGSGELEPQMASLNIPTGLLPFAGAGHVPWDNDQGDMNSVDSALAIYFYNLYCPGPNGIKQVKPVLYQLSVYPNPSNGTLHVALNGGEMGLITLNDITGRQVLHQAANGMEADISAPALAPGIYTLEVELKNSGAIHLTQKVVIE